MAGPSASAEAQRHRPAGMWGRAVRRLTSSTDEYENDTLADLAQASGCRTLNECRPGQEVRLQGRLSTVTLSPRASRRWLEGQMQDGTGVVTLVWMGRATIPGIEAGRMIQVSGRLARRGRDRVIFNPRYELLS